MYGTSGVWPCHMSQLKWPGTGRSGNGPPVTFFPRMTSTVSSLPIRPWRTSSTASRQLWSDRCQEPTWTIRPVSLTTRVSSWPSSTVKVSGFST